MNGAKCMDGSKFVLSRKKGTRKQFLLIKGKNIVGFVKNGQKFAECSYFTEVSSQITCKVPTSIWSFQKK